LSRSIRTTLARLARLFAIDPRSFAVFRVALGSLVIVDLATRAGALADHYSDQGVLPRLALAEAPAGAQRFCLHAWSGAPGFEALLFVVAGALAAAFVLGRGGAAVTILLWALTVSLQNRNDMVLNKGDQIFRLLLFWSVFLPLRPTRPIRSVGGAGLLVQAAVVWLVSACEKSDRAWFPDGTATYYALQMDHGTTAFGHWLGGLFAVTRVLTYGVYFLEWAAAFLLLCPVRTAALRCVAIALLAAMHVGFGLSLRLGLFPAISICSLLPFVPAVAWDRLAPGWKASAASQPDQPSSARTGVAAASASIALAVVLWINAAAVWRGRVSVPSGIDRAARLLRLDQTWAMFAPYPDRAGGWFVISGRLADGRTVDPYHDTPGPPSPDKPRRLSATFPSPRWLYYMTNLSKAEYAARRPWFARYLCRRFDAAHRGQPALRDVEITFYREWSLPGYEKTPARPEVLWRQSCD